MFYNMQIEFSSAALNSGQPTDNRLRKDINRMDVLKKEIAPRGKALVPSVEQQVTKAYFSFNILTPGISSPARYLRVAPPPVDTWLTSFSATPALFIASSVSPPPIRVLLPRQNASAMLFAMFIVPFENALISNIPIGPFQNNVPPPFPPSSAE